MEALGDDHESYKKKGKQSAFLSREEVESSQNVGL